MIEVGQHHKKPNVEWAVHWDESRSMWLIHQVDPPGGIVMARQIKFERSPPMVSDGRMLRFHGELLVNGMTHFPADGTNVVVVDIARIRYCKPSKQSVPVEVIRMSASTTMGG